MHDSPEREDITVIVGRYASGQEQAFDEIYLRYREPMVRIASHTISCQHRRDVCCDAELVVDKAFIDLRTARDHGDLATIENRKQFVGLLKLYVRREIAHERVRAQANKRGGPKAAQVLLDDGGPDVLKSLFAKSDRPEDILLARDEFERLHDLLDDPVQQTILAMRYEGYTLEEICSRMDRSPRTIARGIAVLRQIYARSSGESPTKHRLGPDPHSGQPNDCSRTTLLPRREDD